MTDQQQNYGRPSKKKLVALVIAAVVLIAAALVWVFFLRDLPSRLQGGDTKTCGKDVISQASIAIKNSDIEAMGSVVNNIAEKPNYKHDVDCEYIIERYYIATGNVDKAESTLKDLKAAFNKSSGYSTDFDPPAISIKTLQDSIDTMKLDRQDQLEDQKFYNATDGVAP